MNEHDKFALVPKTPAAIEKAEPGTKRVLSGMVSDALALVKKQQRSKPRIVIVNDLPEAIELMESLIRDRFEEVALLTFRNGVEAWQELQRKAPDLLITDMWREENDPMDGWVLIPLLAEKKVKYPVVVVSGCTENAVRGDDKTGKTLRELLQQARQTLNITFLVAPFVSEEFQELVEACWELRSADIVRPGEIKLRSQEPFGACPKCGVALIERFIGFVCTSPLCDFSIPKYISGRLLSRDEFETLVRDRITGPLGGFCNENGETFSAVLKLNSAFEVEFDLSQNHEQ